jgi:hypothetical protein
LAGKQQRHRHALTTTEQKTQPEPPQNLSPNHPESSKAPYQYGSFGNYETPDAASGKRAAEWHGCNEPITALLNDAANEGLIAVRFYCRHLSQFAVLAQQSNQI